MTKIVDGVCTVPFTDLTIYPNSQLGLRCSDVLEKMNFGNVCDKSIMSIYNK